MTMTDPIADMLARIRNGQMARKELVRVPASSLKKSMLDVLLREGYINGYSDAADSKHPAIDVQLKYFNGKPVISEMKRVSRPGLRRHVAAGDVPVVRSGLGIAVVSTSQGVLSDAEARSRHLGGELLCTVF